MGWTEEQFWSSTFRKFVAMRNEYKKIDFRKTKLILQAINPELDFPEDDQQEQGVYIDQIGL